MSPKHSLTARAAVLALAIVPCACRLRDPESTAASATMTPGPGAWTTVRSVTDGLEVLMPHAPSETGPTAREGGAGPTTSHSWRATDPRGVRYVVVSFAFPPAASVAGESTLLDVVRDRSVRGMHSRVTAERAITVQGQSAREVEFQREPAHDSQGIARIVPGRIPGRVHVLIVAPERGEFARAEAERFFASYRLLP